MPYGSGRLPMERASKLGHMKVIEHEAVRRMIRQFEKTDDEPDRMHEGSCTGSVDLAAPSDIRFIITVDGGEAMVENEIRRDKKLAFITFNAMVLRREQITSLRKCPINDPRDMVKMIADSTWHQAAVLPLAGVHIPGQSIRNSIRDSVDAALEYSGLSDVLDYLVFRRWSPQYDRDPSTNSDAPHMECLRCGEKFYLPSNSYYFNCPWCSYPHRLSDYLGIAQDVPAEGWAREETAINCRRVMEALTLFYFITQYWQSKPEVLSEILFILDGPLLLRAQLGRLVEPIRSLLVAIRENHADLHLVGVEKQGDLADQSEQIGKYLPRPGDFFLPTVQYLVEEVSGAHFDPKTYRNRVQYGAKAVLRLGSEHVVPLNIPTGEFLLEPKMSDLMGFAESVGVLSEMTSYSYDNALIPIILANQSSSISQRPSGDILRAFAGKILSMS